MKKMRDIILEKIDNYTNQGLIDNSFTFDECNALTLSIDLSIDRTNISRILNSLHREKKLIKIKGRPTLYLSLKVINDYFPFNSIPISIESQEKLKPFFKNHALSKADFNKSINYLGEEENDTLFKASSSIFPILYYPFDMLKIIVLYGNEGLGKKTFLQKLFYEGKRSKIFNEDQKIFYFSFDFVNNQSNIILKPDLYPIICIESNPTLDNYKKILPMIEMLYKNENLPLPIVSFVINMNEIPMDVLNIADRSAHFPPLYKRKESEILLLLFELFQEEATRLGRTIIVDKNIFNILYTLSRKLSISQLKRLVISNIVDQMAFDSSEKIIINNKRFTSNNFINTEKVIQTKLSKEMHLVNVTFKVGELLKPSDLLKNSHHLEPLPITKIQSKYISSFLELIIKLPTNLEKYQQKESLSRIKQEIKPILLETILSKDRIVLDFVLDTIEKILSGDIKKSFDPLYLNKPIQDTQAKKITKKISRIVKRTLRTLSTLEEQLLAHLMHDALKSLPNDEITILVNHQLQVISENYAIYLNQMFKKRNIYSTVSSELIKIEQTLSNNLKNIERGKGTIFITEYDPKNSKDNKSLLGMRLLNLVSYPSSLVNIVNISTIINQSKMSVVSLSPKILIEKNKQKSYLQSSTLLEQSVRMNDYYLSLFTKIFSKVNVQQLNEILLDLLVNLATSFNLEINNQLILDFLFHGNCIIDQKITNDTWHKVPDFFDDSFFHTTIYHEISERVKNHDILKKFSFTDMDFIVLSFILTNRLSQK